MILINNKALVDYIYADDDKFGQRLLERMGWSKGKGLGANEDGNVNHITAKFKNDTRGLYSIRCNYSTQPLVKV